MAPVGLVAMTAGLVSELVLAGVLVISGCAGKRNGNPRNCKKRTSKAVSSGWKL